MGCSVFQVSIFSNSFNFGLNSEYEGKATIISSPEIKGELSYWIQTKTLLMKHFEKESYTRLIELETNLIPRLKEELDKNQWNFENIFLKENFNKRYESKVTSDQKSLHDMTTYNSLKESISRNKVTKSELDRLLKEYEDLINSNPLLIKSAKNLTRMFCAMTTLSKITSEPICSWQMSFKERNYLIDSVIAKIVRDLNSNKRKKQRDHENSSEDGHTNNKAYFNGNDGDVDLDVIIDHVILNVYSVVCSGYAKENIPLFNLIFALEIGQERGTVTNEEYDFFFKNFLKFENYKQWRQSNTNFVRLVDKMDKSEFIRLKRNQLKVRKVLGQL